MGNLTQNLVPATVPTHRVNQGRNAMGSTEDERARLIHELARTVLSIRQLAEDLKVEWIEVNDLADQLYRDLNETTT